jgi:3-hydroxyacyl-[acyl-carrier-protein] dehydratase
MTKYPSPDQVPIIKLIPHRHPMVLVDRLIESHEKTASSSFKIPKKHAFVANSKLTVEGAIENIAQTAAANLGYLYHISGSKVPRGFIGAVNKLTINELPKIGTVIQTRISVLQEVFGITLIEGIISRENEICLTCQMKIVAEQTQ